MSDIHLGTAGCKAETLLDFLRHHESDTLYLVGDIIDGWALKSRFFSRTARRPPVLRDGRLLWVVHGDFADGVIRNARSYAFLRWFRRKASSLLTPTAAVERELAAHGLTHVARWTRGVDIKVFRPNAGNSPQLAGTQGPRFLYVGRVSVEKNIEAFLNLDLPGTKIVAGIGPSLELLRRRFPEVKFVGVLAREELAACMPASTCSCSPVAATPSGS